MAASATWALEASRLSRSPAARERARKARQLVVDGIEPIDARNKTRGTAATTLTFR
jgi:hypothetical protein